MTTVDRLFVREQARITLEYARRDVPPVWATEPLQYMPYLLVTLSYLDAAFAVDADPMTARISATLREGAK